MEPSFFICIGILLLFVIFVACLCSSSKPKETQRYPDLKEKVIFFSHECGDITWMVNKKEHRISLKPNKSMSDKDLQKKAKECVSDCPINTKLRITNYAWDLVEVLTDSKLLPENWEPVSAYCFCNGVVMVRYAKKPSENGKSDSSIKDLYFSTADGHLIYFIN